MLRGRIFLPWLLLAVSSGAAEFYVAPNGSDANPGTKAKPFGTLGRARDEVRRWVARGLKSNVTVLLRGGTYQLSEPLVLGLEDSGTDRCTVTWAAFPGEEPVLTSGVPIEGWKELETTPGEIPEPARGKVWVADVPKELGRFHTLYDAQGALPRARGEGFVPEDPPAGVDPDPLRTLYFPAGALRNWPNIDDVEIVIRPSIRWTMNILALESVDERARSARTQLPATNPLRKIPRETYKTAWVENVLEALDQPGEWVLDTHTRKVYLWPRGDAPHGVTAPRLRELVRVEGKVDLAGPTDVPVRGLVFRGLTFTGADRDLWAEGDVGIQHDWEMIDKPDGLLRFRGAERCTVQNCKFRDSGGNAIRLDLHARYIRVEGNEIRHMGQGGIMLIGYGPGAKDVNNHNEILNNHIHHSGLIYWHSHAIVIWQSGENRVAHNFIHHMPRKAVCLSGVRVPFFRQRCTKREICGSLRWNEVGGAKEWDAVMPFLHTRKNLIESNEVARVLEKMGDGAAINVTGAGEENIIRRNFVHDIFSSEGVSGCLRTDDFQRGTLWEENVIYRSNAGAWEHKGANSVVNNFAIDLKPGGYFRVFRVSIDGSVIERNIFYQHRGEAKFYTFTLGPHQIAKTRVEKNIYFSPDTVPKFLEEIRKHGAGLSDVFEDPRFVDPEHGDFRFQPGSPALKLGIRPIDLTGVGLTKDFPKRLLE